ncbi:MAG: hypothetical protein MZV70_49835 [Desulfobacterales bacterium]|nr:hypothetical protein [Desulfobacterales bacterium]
MLLIILLYLPDRLEGHPHRAPRPGPLRQLPGDRADVRAGAADLHQHGGDARAAAHQGADRCPF